MGLLSKAAAKEGKEYVGRVVAVWTLDIKRARGERGFAQSGRYTSRSLKKDVRSDKRLRKRGL